MSDSIQKVTLENAAEQLKLKIRNAFVELLPEEQWKDMVETELKRFTETTTQPKYSGSFEKVEVPSQFSVICREVFGAYIKEEVSKILQSPEWREQWGSGQRGEISAEIKAWLTEHSKEIIQSTVQALAGQAAQQLITNMAHR